MSRPLPPAAWQKKAEWRLRFSLAVFDIFPLFQYGDGAL